MDSATIGNTYLVKVISLTIVTIDIEFISFVVETFSIGSLNAVALTALILVAFRSSNISIFKQHISTKTRSSAISECLCRVTGRTWVILANYTASFISFLRETKWPYSYERKIILCVCITQSVLQTHMFSASLFYQSCHLQHTKSSLPRRPRHFWPPQFEWTVRDQSINQSISLFDSWFAKSHTKYCVTFILL